jgi:predicted cupin superfamily sugar epimerase
MLRTETNTPKMQRLIVKEAQYALSSHRRKLQMDFEHGHWWATCRKCGMQWSVVDCATEAGREYFDFEEVSAGDESCL